MKNKTIFTIGLISIILCVAFVVVVVVMMDHQQNMISNQTQLLDQSQKQIEEKDKSLSEFENGERYSKISQELSTLQNKVQENETEIQEKTAELTRLNEELNQNLTKIAQQEQTLIEQEKTINEQSLKIEVLSQDIDYDDQLTLIQQQKERINSLLEEISNLQEKLTQNNETIEKLNSEINSLKKQIDDLTFTIETGELPSDTDLATLLREKQSELNQTRELLDKQNQTISNLEETNESLQQKIDSFDELMTEKDNQILTLFSQIAQLNKEIKALGDQLAQKDKLLDTNTTHYIVYFVADNALISKEVVKKGENVANVPQIPQKNGYLGSWSEDGSKIAENKFIYAIYTPINYEVNFDLTYSENTPFRFATFYLNEVRHTIDFLKNTVSYNTRVEIKDNKFTINNTTYTLDSKTNCVISGKQKYALDNGAFIADRIYTIDGNFVTWENSVAFTHNTFEIEGKTYTLSGKKVIADEFSTDIISFSQPSKNYTIYTVNNTLAYQKDGNKQTLAIKNDEFTIDKKTYYIDYINYSFNRLISKSSFKPNADLPTSFTIEDKYFVLPKDISSVVNDIVVDNKTLRPSSWQISGIDYLTSEDENYIYIFPISQANVQISINWK